VMQIVLEDPPLPYRTEYVPGATVEYVHELALAESHIRFHLSKELPFRAVLVRGSDVESYLVVVLQHVATDGWSKGILRSDLPECDSHFASGAPLGRGTLTVQYADYAIWERGELAREIFPTQIEWWKETLRGAPALLSLPTDKPRPARQTFHGDST